MRLGREDVERFLHAAWVVDPRAGLRADDLRKAAQLTALLPELLRARGGKGRGPGVVVDAAAGRGGVGLLAAHALAEDARPWSACCLERDPGRLRVCEDAAARLALPVRVTQGEVEDAALWPEDPEIVVALHACGGATDAILDNAVGVRTRTLLLVPCCYGARQVHEEGPYRPPRAQVLVENTSEILGFPDAGLVRAQLARALIDADRTLRLEAAGYQTEVVELFPASLSPFNRLWRARRVGEPVRRARAAARLARLWGAREPA